MIDYGQLEYAPCHLYFYEGKPFTGLAGGIEDGRRFQYEFLDGLENGDYQEWHLDGTLAEICGFCYETMHGTYR